MLPASIYWQCLLTLGRATSKYLLLDTIFLTASVSLIKTKDVVALMVRIPETRATSNGDCGKIAQPPQVMKSHQADRGADASKGLV